MEKLHLNWLVPIFYEKIIHFFNKQPSCEGSNVKNGLKVKQLAEQLPSLKTLMQKILVLDFILHTASYLFFLCDEFW